MFPSMMSTPAILEIRLTQKKIKEITSQDFQFVPDSLSLYIDNISGAIQKQYSFKIIEDQFFYKMMFKFDISISKSDN